MRYVQTYKYKLSAIAKWIKLYDEFLQTTSLNFNDRLKLMQEITRLESIKKRIESLPISSLDIDCKDFNIRKNSSINENRTKNQFRHALGRKSNYEQSV